MPDQVPPADAGGQGGSRRLQPQRPGRAHRRGGQPALRRGPVIAVLAVLAIAGGLADRVGGPRLAAAAPVPDMPVATPASALSSAWFCAGATASSGGAAPGSLVIANPTANSLMATVDLLPSSGKRPPAHHVVVAARSRMTVSEAVTGGSPWVGAVVHVEGGGVSVSQDVSSGTLGTAVEPCATAGSRHWYFPSGTTMRDATDMISLLNPYPGEAIVNLSFTTNQGNEAPVADQAIAVNGDSLTTVNLGDHLRRRVSIATTVSAVSGRVVAWQTLSVTPPAAGTPIIGEPPPAGYSGPLDPAPPVGGTVLTLGAAAPAKTWWWPDGVAGNGVNEQYVVYNPGPAAAQLRLVYGLSPGGSQPVSFTVGPNSVKAVTTSAESQVPTGAVHNATLSSTNGVPVVAERTITATSPSTHTGLGGLLGATKAAPRWLLGAAGNPAAHLDEWLEVQNPGSRPVTVSLSQVGSSGPTAIRGLRPVKLAAGGRMAVNVSSHLSSHPGGPLLVQASGPVVTERDLYGTGVPGIGLSLGVPLS